MRLPPACPSLPRHACDDWRFDVLARVRQARAEIYRYPLPLTVRLPVRRRSRRLCVLPAHPARSHYPPPRRLFSLIPVGRAHVSLARLICLPSFSAAPLPSLPVRFPLPHRVTAVDAPRLALQLSITVCKARQGESYPCVFARVC